MPVDEPPRISRVEGLALVRLHVPRANPSRRVLDTPLPSAGRLVTAGRTEIFWRSPAVWWLKSRSETARALIAKLETSANTIDISDAQVTFAISGSGAREIVASGCALDLDPQSFPSGSATATRCDHFDMVIHARRDDAFDLHVPRSYAADAEQWAHRVLARSSGKVLGKKRL